MYLRVLKFEPGCLDMGSVQVEDGRLAIVGLLIVRDKGVIMRILNGTETI
jgi:hypothetical protein